MRKMWILGAVALASCALLAGCLSTGYQKVGLNGGYDDFPLGYGKYHVVATGNQYTSASRVRDIAFLRAAELSKSLGNKGFYILDRQGSTDNQIVIDNVSVMNSGYYYGTPFYTPQAYNVETHKFQITIQPTDSPNGIDVQATFDRYKALLGQ